MANAMMTINQLVTKHQFGEVMLLSELMDGFPFHITVTEAGIWCDLASRPNADGVVIVASRQPFDADMRVWVLDHSRPTFPRNQGLTCHDMADSVRPAAGAGLLARQASPGRLCSRWDLAGLGQEVVACDRIV